MISLLDVHSKIGQCGAYCVNRIQADPDILPADKTLLLELYMEGLAALNGAVSGYIHDTANKEHQLRNLIMQMYSALSINGIFDIPQASIVDLYAANKKFQQILDGDISQLWAGYPISVTEPIPTILSLVGSINQAEAIDSAGRTALYNSMFALQSNRVLPLMFGEEVANPVFPLSKRSMGSIIYSDYGVKSIIQEYSLNVFIPNFVL
jgi:hypothetical protein